MKVNWLKASWVAVLVVSWVVFGWLSLDSKFSRDQFIDCLADRLQDRSIYNEADWESLRIAFQEFGNATTSAQARAAMIKFNGKLAETKLLRAKAPIPTDFRACD